ncbi:hypothetical protein [Vibrio sp. T11.5]|uniref:hypothetical protein n=1 Tax=Vibrio sp. T11.5 TaxID=2998836 RepID=UPI0022CD50D0|nr:hypothetical protein [Vibrio sp. T11.5]MDA0120203.1 hypothetical protein [Vibrio sp. T11.5]
MSDINYQYLRPKKEGVLSFSDGDKIKEINLAYRFSYCMALTEMKLLCVFDDLGSKHSLEAGKVYDFDGNFCFDIPYPSCLNLGNEIELFFSWCSYSCEGLNIVFSASKTTVRDFSVVYDLENRVYSDKE